MSHIELKIIKQCKEARKCDLSSGGELANIDRPTEDPDLGMSKKKDSKIIIINTLGIFRKKYMQNEWTGREF